MTSALTILAAFVAGLGLGAFFFGALWLTVQRLPTARFPALLMFASFWGRLGLAGAVFYCASMGGLGGLVACLAGFILLRMLMVRRITTQAGIGSGKT